MTNYKVGNPDTTPADGDCDSTNALYWCTRELGHAGQHAAGDGDRIKAAWGDPEPETVEGVWAIVDRDYHESITVVYPTEVDALRVLNGRGYGKVKFVPYGKTLSDIGEG